MVRRFFTVWTVATGILVAVVLVGAVSLGHGLLRLDDRPAECGGFFEICDDGD